jgi:soluble lytic murein transglycosylase
MHDHSGTVPFAPTSPRLLCSGSRVALAVLAALLLAAPPVRAAAPETGVPAAGNHAADAAEPTKKPAGKKASPSKTRGGKSKAAPKHKDGKAAGKSAQGKTGAKKGAKKPAAKPLPAAAKAPPLPRVEPFTLSARDRETFGEAMKAVEARQWPKALAAAARSDKPVLAKIVTWAYIREPGAHASFAERTAFIANNPGWPGLQTIQRRAEEALDESVTVTVPSALVAWFSEHPPLTPGGKAAYARALKSVGNAAEATRVARDAWRSGTFDRGNERAFLDVFAADLRPEDERARLDRLLYEENAPAADRQIARVDPIAARVGRARIALFTSAGNADALVAAIPPERLDDPGLIYDRVKWRRRQDKTEAARALLPRGPDTGPRTDLMWKERAILARDALNAGAVSEAYTIAKNHGEIDAAGGLADAEWLAGWIALRFLKDGEAALGHFEKVYDTVQIPANVARGAYWTGRAAEFLGRTDIADDWYRRAATYITTYYGQLALGRLKQDPIPALSDDPVPSVEDRNAFEERELTKAMRALADVRNKTYLRTFVLAAADSTGDAAERHLVAEFSDRIGHPDLGVSLAREAARDGIPLLVYGYPLPAYPVPSQPERALVLGIARQESNFDPNAQSVAGALGLMQLMPPTAKAIAKRSGVKYVQTRLTSDPAYNLALGAAFLRGLVDSFDGSYLLAAAAYNAGPGRVRQWMRQYGDPRDGQTDPVDWVEQIPFAETRAYVQRVMENVMIYRARLAKTRVIGPTLEAELVRAKASGPANGSANGLKG